MIENNYYDPFLITNYFWGNRNSELNITFPSFLYRTKDFLKNDFIRLEYLLQWKNKKSKNSEWSIYRFSLLTGDASVFLKGIGYEDYTNNIDSLSNIGISQNMIMFGGTPTKEDSIRLGL
jgi:hypothetical protein